MLTVNLFKCSRDCNTAYGSDGVGQLLTVLRHTLHPGMLQLIEHVFAVQLDLTLCWRVTDEGLTAISGLFNLKHLDIAYCWQVGKVYLQATGCGLLNRAMYS